jgi:hypothetical protein
MRRLMHLLVGAAAACSAAFGAAGCSSVQSLNPGNVVRAVSQADAFSAANERAPLECSKADAGATFATATYAGYAADQLRKSGLDPQPWAAMSPLTIIYQCYGNPPTGVGVYVDSSGQKSVAPPVTSGKPCVVTSSHSCSSPISFASP